MANTKDVIRVEVKTIARVVMCGPQEMWAVIEKDGDRVEALFENSHDAEYYIDDSGYSMEEYSIAMLDISASTPKEAN